MNKFLILLIIISICTAENTFCYKEEREIKDCGKQQQKPVCAIKIIDKQNKYNQSTKNYENRCEACKDKDSDFVVEGNCGEYPSNAIFCHPDQHLHQKKQSHNKEYHPVCGQFDNPIRCIRSPCNSNYSSRCAACSDRQVKYFTEGYCQEQHVDM